MPVRTVPDARTWKVFVQREPLVCSRLDLRGLEHRLGEEYFSILCVDGVTMFKAVFKRVFNFTASRLMQRDEFDYSPPSILFIPIGSE